MGEVRKDLGGSGCSGWGILFLRDIEARRT